MCSPKPEPEKAAPVARAPRVARTSLRSTPAGSGSARSGTARSVAEPRSAQRTTPPPLNVETLRVYHVTHVDNLPAILKVRELRADARPPVDISSAGSRDIRRSLSVTDESVVADYVPFFLSPDARVWTAIRAGEPDPRLQPVTAPASDFVMLATTVQAVRAAGETVVADRDAVNPLTRFFTDPDVADRRLRQLQSEDSDELLDAELLVADTFPFESVALIGVGNDRVRDIVKRELAASGFRTKVAVYPPWFLPVD